MLQVKFRRRSVCLVRPSVGLSDSYNQRDRYRGKTAESIEIPCAVLGRMDSRNDVLDGYPDAPSPREEAFFWGGDDVVNVT